MKFPRIPVDVKRRARRLKVGIEAATGEPVKPVRTLKDFSIDEDIDWRALLKDLEDGIHIICGLADIQEAEEARGRVDTFQTEPGPAGSPKREKISN